MKYLKFLFALTIVYFVVTVAIPALNRTPFLNDFQKKVRKWDINTSAFFYTDNISSNKHIKKYTDL